MIRAILLLLPLLTGCGGTITPPRHVADPVTIYVKLDARHSAIVLPRPSGSCYVEYSFGAWRWFALADTRWPVAFSSLLGFMQATLQTNELPLIDGQPATLEAVKLIAVTVDRNRADALRMELDARYDRKQDTHQYNRVYDMHFVHDSEHYHVLNNCNQVTARWLRRLGCRVDGLTLTNDFKIHQGHQPHPTPPGRE